MLVGSKADGQLGIFERTFNRCMGLWSDSQTMWMSSRYQLWRMENMLRPGEMAGEFDRLYVPQLGYTTGDIDIHDISVGQEGRPVFVTTLFNSVATISDRYSFEPLWRPPFISKMAAEDRCHLNGLAMQNGSPKYLTACSQSDVVDGWRDRRDTGGVVLDYESGEVVARGFSMPHSPRLYQDRLWVLDSGSGYFGYVDTRSGGFRRVTFCPGYARGLAFHDHFAIIGLSRPRKGDTSFHGLSLDQEMTKRDATARCGFQVVDLHSGDVIEWLRIDGGVVEELYDVVVLPETNRPKAFGFKTDEIERSSWFNNDGEIKSWFAGPTS